MLRPEFGLSGSAPSASFERVAASIGAPAPQRFDRLMGEVRADIVHFIENGNSQDGTGLSVEGGAHRARALAGMQQQAAQSAGIERGEGVRPVSTPTGLRAKPAAAPTSTTLTGPLGVGKGVGEGLAPDQKAFVSGIAGWAREAGKRLGVSPDIVAAHAALESGWGKRPLRDRQGGDSKNLFGLKAGSSWRGQVVEALTTEYEDGVAVRRTDRFRRYPDERSAFQDYARLLMENPRYEGARNAGSDAGAYADGLVRGGYATDEKYRDKLVQLVKQMRAVARPAR